MSNHTITRDIGIDMGHRVTHHGSKCQSLHGHRYKITAICSGGLFSGGEQEGMVLDFGFLKDEMMETIDKFCDHGTVLWDKDELVDIIYPESRELLKDIYAHALDQKKLQKQKEISLIGGSFAIPQGICKAGKLVITPFVPTAENLARWWFDLLLPRVIERSDGRATLQELQVWETPNCSASYKLNT